MEHNPPQTPEKRSILARVFLSPERRRLRAGWRLLGQLLIWILLNSILFVILSVILSFGGITPSFNLSFFLVQLTNALAITLSVYIARGYLDQQSFTSLGLLSNRQGLIDLLVGVGITLVMFLAIFLIQFAAGWLRFDGFSWQADLPGLSLETLVLYFAIMILVGWQEEILWRGYWLQNLADGLNMFWGIVISSVIFAGFHLINPGSSWISSLGIFIAGIFLAYGYQTTRQLWLPIGLHIGWNFFEGPIFGFPVSGLETPAVFLHTSTGPTLITGGRFGPEAGLIFLPALLIGVGLIYLYTRRRNLTAMAGTSITSQA